MRKILLLFAIPIFAFVLACASPDKNANVAANAAPAATPAPGDTAPRITLAEAKKDFDAGAAIFVDSRPESAYKAEHIQGAINISGDILDAHLKELPKDKKIIVYCS
jgi:hypothetical protein